MQSLKRVIRQIERIDKQMIATKDAIITYRLVRCNYIPSLEDLKNDLKFLQERKDFLIQKRNKIILKQFKYFI